MKVEEIRNLQVDCSSFQIRVGRMLTVIELMNGGKPTGRDLTIRNNTELDELIEGLTKAKEFLKTL